MNILQPSRQTTLKIIPVLAAALLALASPQEASAQSFIVGDCITFTNNFFDNEPVCVTGTTAGSFFSPNALVCILPSTGGGPADDVTPGGCNSFPPAFTMIDEMVWLPPTDPGTYIAVLFASNGAVLQDVIIISSSGGAAPTIDVAAIKAQAGIAAATWEATALFGANLSTFHSAYSIGVAAATGNIIGVVVGIAGEVLGIPTDYNGAVLQVGGQIISILAGNQAAMYATLEADPPDPMFTDTVPLDIAAINADLATKAPLYPLVPLQYPFANLSQDSLHLAAMEFANSMTVESALGTALTRTFEKFQGAEVAGDDQFMLLQARALKDYADQLVAQLAKTRQGAVDYKAELAADGLAAIVYDAADIAALTARLLATGFTAEEDQALRAAGYTDEDFTVMFNRFNTLTPPIGVYSIGGGMDSIVASIDQLQVVFQDMSSQAQAVIDHFAPLVTEQHPTANAGGPYAGNEGALINFDATGSNDPQAQLLTVDWDFDLDGLFDDATGAMVSNTYNAPTETQVGVRLTDTDGNEDIAYASVSIAEVNGPPQITKFDPVCLALTASNQSPLDFSATVTDPDMDVVDFEWRVDGAVVSTAAGFRFTPGVGEIGTRTVQLTVGDSNPLSEDTIESRLVRLVDDVSFQALVAVPNIGDGAAPELGVALSGSLNGYVRDAGSDALLGTQTFSADRTPLDMGVVDINGSPAIAVLVRDGTGRAWVEVRDAVTGAVVRNVWFSSGYTPVAMAVLPDMNGNGTSEVAVLMTKCSDNRAWVHIKDSQTLAYVNNVWFEAGYTPLDLEYVPNVDGNAGPELAVLTTRDIDNRTWVHVKDAMTGAYVRKNWFQAGFTPKDLAVIDNLDGNPGAELAVLFTRDSDTRTWVHMKDTLTGAYVKNVWFDLGFTPTRLAIVPDLDANVGDELAVLSTKDADGRAWVLVRDALSGDYIRNVWFQGGFAPKDFAVLPNMDGNAGSELAVLGEKTGGQMQVEIKDTQTNAYINQVDFP